MNSILRFLSVKADRLDTKFERQSAFGMPTCRLAECFEPLAQQCSITLVLERGLRLTTPSNVNRQTSFNTQACHSVKEAIIVNQDLCEQVLIDILSNAFKNTSEGSIVVLLYEHMQNERDGVQLGIAETGVGLPCATSRLDL